MGSLLWLLLAGCGFVGFVMLAGRVHQPGFTAQDFAITQQFHQDTGGGLETILIVLGEFGRSILVFIVLELVVWLGLRRQWREIVALLAVACGAFALNEVVRHALAAPRIPLHAPFVPIRDTGFPSGHAMMATVLYGLLLWAAFPRIPRELRLVAAVSTVCLVLLVGYTRMFFGDHYLSDVLGGYTLGMSWLAACIAMLSWLGIRWRGR
jgi:undecaprenyl-diphosphatase